MMTPPNDQDKVTKALPEAGPPLKPCASAPGAAGAAVGNPPAPIGAGPYQAGVAKKEKVQRQYTARERLLILLALIGGVCFERFVFSSHQMSHLFWLAVLVLFYLFQWEKLKHNRILWYVAGCAAVLCAWPLLFDYSYYTEYGHLNAVVVPGVIMAHTQFAGGSFRLKQPLAVAMEWIVSWFVKPFSAIPHFFGSIGSVQAGKNSRLRKALLGVGVSLPLLLIILPLLAGADMVFAYHLNQLLRRFSILTLAARILAVGLSAMCLYSFLWNNRYAKPLQAAGCKEEWKADSIIFTGVLSTVLLVYALFCGVQFAYLFAQAGLPEGMTYSEYAREGFWQLIAIAGINLALFGVVLQFSRKSRLITVLQSALLAMTGVILVSGFLRLRLYIEVYHLTWLRLLSAWFILYLAVVLVLCGVRMARPGLPLVAVCSFVLLGWFTALGYANPDGLVARYNLTHAADQSTWIRENRYQFYNDSADRLLALVDLCEDQELLEELLDWNITKCSFPASPRSLSALRRDRLLEEYRQEHFTAVEEDGRVKWVRKQE